VDGQGWKMLPPPIIFPAWQNSGLLSWRGANKKIGVRMGVMVCILRTGSDQSNLFPVSNLTPWLDTSHLWSILPPTSITSQLTSMSDAVPFATFCLVFRKRVVGSHENTERPVMLTFTNNACLSRLCSVLFCCAFRSQRICACRQQISPRPDRLDYWIECLSNRCFLNYCLQFDFRRLKYCAL